jgi:hypothetical protein
MNEEEKKLIIYMFPMLFIVIFLPFLIFIKQIELKGILYYAWTGEEVNYNLFTYYRSIVLLVVAIGAIIMLIMFMFETHKELSQKIKKSKNIFILFVYLGLAVASTILSIYYEIAIFGFVERYEGILSIASYVVFFIFIHVIINSDFQVKVLLFTITISSTVLSIIGIFQYFGFDILQWGVTNGLLLPEELHHMRFNLILPSTKNTIYMTLYNSNNVGSYMAMLFPISIGLYLYAKKRIFAILFGLYSCLMFANWIGCRSRAGMVAGIVSILFILILMWPECSKNKKKFIIVMPYIFILLIMNNSSEGSLLRKVSTLSPQVEQELSQTRYIPIQDMVFDESSVQIITNENTLAIEVYKGQIYFKDQNDVNLDHYFTEDKYIFNDERYKDYSFIVEQEEDMSLLLLDLRGMKINYCFDESGIFLIGNHKKLVSEFKKAPKIGFEGRERFGSGRGYVWSRTLPLLKETIWLGNGPDTLPFYFPQDDYIGKLNNFGKVNVVVDKPHNFYLQVAHDSGVISLIALLLFFASYFIQSLRLYMFNKSGSFVVNMGKILMCSVLGYLIAAIFNDSVVYVAPYFWILLGAGFAVNYMVKYPEEVLST